ncbi:hypothetical protein [Roseinatronobacter bogoriensis]|uniref:hypothetical protein n=1 Tax=Roseinatronobacter bogoriensis TaxID=119542 RepID=UPI0010657587|nr:hypothetical protein [Rhodobaca bogoriensis]MBB4207242.1 hypothetical protein [Rhodobaca bogoriensis DSM 18756]TDY65743.1 hypothetical protein EV660_11711 [Rhodobaca bogoriensis DSM 18756]
MPNSLSDLQAALFAQLDRVIDPQLSKEDLETEIKRSEAVRDLADQITGSANTQLKAAKLYADHGKAVLPHLPQIGSASPREISE